MIVNKSNDSTPLIIFPEDVIHDAFCALGDLSPAFVKKCEKKEIEPEHVFKQKLCLNQMLYNEETPTDVGTSPSQLRDASKKIYSKFNTALNALKEIDVEIKTNRGQASQSLGGSLDIAMDDLRFAKVDRAISRNLLGRDMETVFDRDLTDAIVLLESLRENFIDSCNHFEALVSRRGAGKGALKSFDCLLLGFCEIYHEFTGKSAMAWYTGSSTINSNKVYGPVLPFLQTILPYTYYKGELSDTALQKKLQRLRDSARDLKIWQDN